MTITISVAATGTDRWVEVADYNTPKQATAHARRIFTKAKDTLSVAVREDGNPEPLALHEPLRFTPLGKKITQWKRPPIDHAMLVRLIRTCDPGTLRGARDQLIFAVMWELTMPRGEVEALTVEDFTEHRLTPFPSQAVQRLFTQWMAIRLERFTQWMQDHDEPELRPLATTGPLFLRVDQIDQPTSGGLPLMGDGINDALQRAVHATKTRGLFSTDSLLLGGQRGE